MLILKMIEEGRLTAAEGAELLEALEEELDRREDDDRREEPGDTAAQVAARAERVVERLSHQGEKVMSKVARGAGRVAADVEKMLSRLPGMVENLAARLDLPALGHLLGPRWRFQEEIKGELPPGPEPVTVVVDTYHGQISVTTWDEPGYRLLLTKLVHHRREEEAAELAVGMAQVSEKQGELHVRAEPGPGQAGVGIRLWLPRNRTYRLILRTANGRITLAELEAAQVEATTANGQITATQVVCPRASFSTANGSIELAGRWGDLRAGTSHGRIQLDLEDITGPRADIHLGTSHARIGVTIVAAGDIGYDIDAATGLGRIQVDLPHLEFETGPLGTTGRDLVRARSAHFGEQPRRVFIRAQTSHGDIIVGARETDG